MDREFGVLADDDLRDGANCAILVGKAPELPDHGARLKWLDGNLSLDHFTAVLERWDAEVSDLTARALLADYDQVRPEGVAQTRMIQVHAPRKGRLYQLTCTSHRTTFETRRAVFDQIIAGWEVPPDVHE